MKHAISCARSLAFVFAASGQAALAMDMGTAFTYQGYLENPLGVPVSGSCNLEFTLWDDPVSVLATDQIGPTLTFDGATGNPPPVVMAGGVFSVVLDFDAEAFNGTARWLDIKVCCPSPCVLEMLSPRVELTPAPHALALPGLYTRQNGTSPNIIGGYSGNLVSDGVFGATISGGGGSMFVNSADGNYATVSGGWINSAVGSASNVGGGTLNSAIGLNSSIGGGYGNVAEGQDATVAGGTTNSAFGGTAAVGGGTTNTATGSSSTIAGGDTNSASGNWSTVGGGHNNAASATVTTVGGGSANTASGAQSTIAGGFFNSAGGFNSAVGGGQSNVASGLSSTVPGGNLNVAGGDYSFAAGRRAKVRDAAGSGDADGDEGTFVWADTTAADFASTGPDQFLIRASGGVGIGTNDPDVLLHMVGGTEAGLADGTGYMMLGGTSGTNMVFDSNEIQVRFLGSGSNLFLNPAGGDVSIRTTATGVPLTVGGGTEATLSDSTGYLTIGTDSSANIVMDSNEIQARSNGVAEELLLNPAGGSVAIGSTPIGSGVPLVVDGGTDAALPVGSGYVVIGDENGQNIVVDDNEIIARTFGDNAGDLFLNNGSGFIGILRSSTSHPIHVGTNSTNGNGAHLTAGGAWTNGSDRNTKENFHPLDSQWILERVAELPLSKWNYIGEADGVCHIGPMAQDFRAAFGLGHDERYITTIDADGVALAAIQGLYELVQEKNCEIDEFREQKDRETDELRSQISNLKSAIEALATRQAGAPR